ncbi:hypothetical protein Bpfe_000158 [Biomphalaria pfeifferi]|uniref:Uncharacterized protein n=1 Tax=Biomphalaria pfeifferi TaxID=112525 RepID=A0AAD8FMZ2_BIOPF|nr:hypothetical protein Bpfe_000158 [Biomphalaria pfeifferi]
MSGQTIAVADNLTLVLHVEGNVSPDYVSPDYVFPDYVSPDYVSPDYVFPDCVTTVTLRLIVKQRYKTTTTHVCKKTF